MLPVAGFPCRIGDGPDDDFVAQQFVVNHVTVAAGHDALTTGVIMTADARELANLPDCVGHIRPNVKAGSRAF
jgi:hypothetical protein